jgi:hypothetical protein
MRTLRPLQSEREGQFWKLNIYKKQCMRVTLPVTQGVQFWVVYGSGIQPGVRLPPGVREVNLRGT